MNAMDMCVLSVLGSTPGVCINQPYPLHTAVYDVSEIKSTYDSAQRSYEPPALSP